MHEILFWMLNYHDTFGLQWVIGLRILPYLPPPRMGAYHPVHPSTTILVLICSRSLNRGEEAPWTVVLIQHFPKNFPMYQSELKQIWQDVSGQEGYSSYMLLTWICHLVSSSNEVGPHRKTVKRSLYPRSRNENIRSKLVESMAVVSVRRSEQGFAIS